jgi:hypothetical protein
LSFYVRQLPQILSLDQDPGNAHAILEATGWTEGRLAYVCVKVGIGLIMLLDPDDPRLPKYPLFVAPLEEEMALIAQMEAEISKAFRASLRAQDQRGRRPSQRSREP